MKRAFLVLLASVIATPLARAQTTVVTVNGGQVTFTGQVPPEVIQQIVTQGQTAQNGQPARDNRPQTGTGSVRGRVVSDTGQPMRRIIVQLQGASTPHATTTDVDGGFEFTALPPGHFTLVANRTGYIAARSESFDLADNQRLDGLNLRMQHGGVITGQIVDEYGEPLIGATVSPMRQQYANGQRRLMNAGQTTITNDVGEYRLFGLQAGAYYVSVSPRNDSMTMPVGPVGPGTTGPVPTVTTSSPTGYAPTYYPGTPDMASAQPILVTPAQTVTGISFSLTAVRLAKVQGYVLDETGQPVAGRGNVNLMPRGASPIGMIGTNGQIQRDGSFTLNNVPPGSYYVRATIPLAGPMAPPVPGTPPRPPTMAVAEVAVNGEDVTGLVLAPVRPAVIHGRVTFDDPTAAASVKPSTVRLTAQRIDTMGPPLIIGPPATTVVHDDFTFEMSASPEPSNIRASVPSTTRGPGDMANWRLRAVYVHGQDVTDTGVDLRPDASLDDVEIAMTTIVQTISGTVSSDGAPVPNAPIVIFAADRDRWVLPFTRYVARASTGKDGTFKILFLPPGSYYAVASVPNQTPPPDWNDPDVLEAATRTATRFSIGEGGTASLDLKLPR